MALLSLIFLGCAVDDRFIESTKGEDYTIPHGGGASSTGGTTPETGGVGAGGDGAGGDGAGGDGAGGVGAGGVGAGGVGAGGVGAGGVGAGGAGAGGAGAGGAGAGGVGGTGGTLEELQANCSATCGQAEDLDCLGTSTRQGCEGDCAYFSLDACGSKYQSFVSCQAALPLTEFTCDPSVGLIFTGCEDPAFEWLACANP